MKSQSQDLSRVELPQGSPSYKVSAFLDASSLWQASASQYGHRFGVKRTEIRPDYALIKSRVQNVAQKLLVELGELPDLQTARAEVEFDLHLCISSSRSASSGSGRGFLDRMEGLGWKTHIVHRSKGSPRFDWTPSICCLASEVILKEKPSLLIVGSGSGAFLPLESLSLRSGVPFMMIGFLDSLCSHYTRTSHLDESVLMDIPSRSWGTES